MDDVADKPIDLLLWLAAALAAVTWQWAIAIAIVAVACAVALLAVIGRLPHRVGFLQSADAVSAASAQSAASAPPHALRRAPVDLRVTLWPHGPAGASRSWRITCPGAGCRAARARIHDLATEPNGACPPGDDGMGEALIIGRVGGRLVEDWLDHRDGCNVHRWHRLRQVLRPPVAPAPPRQASAD